MVTKNSPSLKKIKEVLGGKCVVKRLGGHERKPGERVVPSLMSWSGVGGREEVVA